MKPIRVMLAGLCLLTTILIAGSANTQAATPVFGAAIDFRTGCVLGGAQDRKFIPADVAVGKIAGGESYKIYSLQGKLGTAIGGRPESLGVPCENTMDVDVRPSYDSTDVIGLGGNWFGMPRVPSTSSPNSAAYRTAVRDLLRARGLSNPNVRIEQAYRIDLEGDGVTEVLISASYFRDGNLDQPGGGPTPSAAAGDYSILFMRKVVHNRVQTVVFADNVYTQDAEFVAPNQYKINGVVDVNGDGKMEVLLYGRYYEGHWTSVLEIKGTQFEEVLGCGCGV